MKTPVLLRLLEARHLLRFSCVAIFQPMQRAVGSIALGFIESNVDYCVVNGVPIKSDLFGNSTHAGLT
jgi:hypothetical protein